MLELKDFELVFGYTPVVIGSYRPNLDRFNKAHYAKVPTIRTTGTYSHDVYKYAKQFESEYRVSKTILLKYGTHPKPAKATIRHIIIRIDNTVTIVERSMKYVVYVFDTPQKANYFIDKITDKKRTVSLSKTITKNPPIKMEDLNERTNVLCNDLEKEMRELQLDKVQSEVFPLGDDLVQITVEKIFTIEELEALKLTIKSSLEGKVEETEEIEITESSVITVVIKPKEPVT